MVNPRRGRSMGTSLRGAVVAVRFPFSDLLAFKKRPALVVADWGGADVILAQITGVANKDKYAIDLYNNDFINGNLTNAVSFIRPNKLFTAEMGTFLQTIGKLNDAKTDEVADAITAILHLK